MAGYRVAFAAVAALPLACWLLVRGLAETRIDAAPAAAAERHSAWDLLASAALRRLLLANWMQSMAWDAHTFVLPLLGHERGLEASVIGILMGAFALAAALIRMALPRLARKYAEWQVIYAATLLAAAVLLAYPWMPGPIGMGVCSMLLGVALGAVQPMVLSYLNEVAPPGREGEAMALRSLVINSSSFAMPMLFGSIGAVTGTAGLFWLVAGVLGAGSRAIPALGRLEAPRRYD